MMDYKKLQEPLEISDVDFRVQSINKGGYATILAYKDARVDMRRLDEVLGAEYWQRDVKLVNGVVYGGVGIFNEVLNQWIWKWDAGAETYSDKEKGQSSDAFKRACFNLGIGRELYNYPVISVKLNDDEIQDKGGKKYASWNFKLKEWKWLSQFTDGELTFLAAKDNHGKMRFKWGSFDKNRDLVETLASGTPTSNPEEHVSDSPTPAVTSEAEESNVDGFLKKEAEPIEETPKEPTAEEVEWNELAQKHKIIFGKEPRANTKLETLKSKIETETAKRLAEKEAKEQESTGGGAIYSDAGEEAEEVEEAPKADIYAEDATTMTDEELDKAEEVEEVEEDLGMYGGILVDAASKISTFTERQPFVEWATGIVKKYTGTAPQEHIAEFRTACNKHYEQLKA